MAVPRTVQRLFTHNFAWKLLCLGVAALLWLWLIYADNLV